MIFVFPVFDFNSEKGTKVSFSVIFLLGNRLVSLKIYKKVVWQRSLTAIRSPVVLVIIFIILYLC